MNNPSSHNRRNNRNHRNPKCEICGLDLIKSKCPAHKIKGQYVVWVEKEENGKNIVYSTNSVFWRDFFK